MQQTQTDALTIITQVVQVFGWPTLVVLAWKFSRYLAQAEDLIITNFDKLGGKIDTLGSNHLHEVRDELKEVKGAINDLQQAIITAIATRK